MTDKLKIYDKAKYHSEGNFPSALNPEMAHQHIGVMICWLRENALLNDDGVDLCGIDYSKVSAVKLSRRFDGCLSSEVITEKGVEFLDEYYESGMYIDDYVDVLCDDVDTVYHVDLREDDYRRIKARIDERYRAVK